MACVLTTRFFQRPAPIVAQELLGKFLIRRIKNNKKIALMITETEAYSGPRDRASHAFKKSAKKSQVMFRNGGRWYVYFVYGCHWMLNIITDRDSYPSAVLIRGIDKLNGPGKLTKSLKIDKSFNDKIASRKNNLWIEDRDIKIKQSKILKLPRIGIGYAGKYWSRRKWRFKVKT